MVQFLFWSVYEKLWTNPLWPSVTETFRGLGLFYSDEGVYIKHFYNPLHTGSVTKKRLKNTNCLDGKCSDQNCSHRQWHEFVTETEEYEFVKEFWQLTPQRESGLKCYKYDITA